MLANASAQAVRFSFISLSTFAAATPFFVGVRITERASNIDLVALMYSRLRSASVV